MANDEIVWITCCTCKFEFAIPYSLYDAATHTEEIHFYCPYGHKQHFPENESYDKTSNEDRLVGKVINLFKKQGDDYEGR